MEAAKVKNEKLKGFSLIELVLVIPILGILAGLAIHYFLDSHAQARSAKAAVECYLAAGNTVALIGNPKTDGANLFQNMKDKGGLLQLFQNHLQAIIMWH
ncbi:prepilin-type N-terminal cleavage/methylation domain-containing protein [uncultured Phascolarctobacterium sp.]|uniref:prepilin-type N-terminal cleavage/methylation domain-containing protein n=1 Tax=uncultured Phascolarctobacterium sp. TaxID=512296 RepID=UPI0035A6A19C